ncbi:uncharacterized protein LOC131025637 [Salvia miltiorrhiza]|uniref:uncharacterized protein LOC131025637 n=1 Tax=Salvia miltiorrhiza TaxID=226208 RepID=UPI0025AB9603|nr:uncharacterized protein LOC131025637 [Salvia miltiorrhiza]
MEAKELTGSPFTQIAAVFVAVWRRRHLELPSDPLLLFNVDETQSKKKKKQMLPHNKEFRLSPPPSLQRCLLVAASLTPALPPRRRLPHSSDASSSPPPSLQRCLPHSSASSLTPALPPRRRLSLTPAPPPSLQRLLVAASLTPTPPSVHHHHSSCLLVAARLRPPHHKTRAHRPPSILDFGALF